jgi:Flp pilus assembly protein TadG
MHTHRRSRNERGAAAVELAMVLPILIVLIFGIVEFGRAYNAKLQLSAAVREGARDLALGKTATQVKSTVTGAAPGLDAVKLAAAGAVTTSASPCLPGTSATVTVRYPFTYSLPLLFVGPRTITLSATGAMRCEL